MPAWALILVQLLCVGAVVVGVEMINVPAAWITAGVLVFALCEAPGVHRVLKPKRSGRSG